MQGFDLAPGCAVWVGAPPQVWSAIGAKVLSGAGIDDSTPEDQRSTYQEILQQAFAGLAHGLTGFAGREVNAGTGKEDSPPGRSVTVFHLSIGSGPCPVFLEWSEQIARALTPAGSPAAAPKRGESSPAASPTTPKETACETVPEGPTTRTLDLLYDVELPVSVSFGRAHLPLKEVLKLASGSIVELNRTVAEPVEIIVNNCVIARGEVVVVEGNYGVRIQQIISRHERLRTLH